MDMCRILFKQTCNDESLLKINLQPGGVYSDEPHFILCDDHPS